MRTVCRTLALAVAFGVGLADGAAAQVRPVAFGAIGFGNIFRVEDQSFGTEMNVGAGGGIEWKRLGVDVEIHRTTGFTPRQVTCQAAPVPCSGSAREGVLEATAITANVAYLFGQTPVRPYVIGSVGVLKSDTAASLTIARSTWTISEMRRKDTGMVIGGGGGLDVAITRHLSVRPEFQTYVSTLLSRMNLSMHRGAIGVRYRW